MDEFSSLVRLGLCLAQGLGIASVGGPAGWCLQEGGGGVVREGRGGGRLGENKKFFR